MSEADFGLDKKGGHVQEGAAPSVINSGLPTGDSPGPGDLTPPFAGEHVVGGPVSSGPIK